MLDEIREIVRRYADLPVDPASLDPEEDLYRAGMTSHAGVNVMLALEDRFDIEFPDRLLTRSSFASIANMQRVVAAMTDPR
jgi:acyl carrier protein